MQNSVFGYPPSKGDAMPCYKERHPLLLDCFIPFLKYIRVVGRATGSIDESLMVHNMSAFLPITNIKFHANLRFWAPSQHRNCAAVLQGEVSIVDQVFHNLPPMCKDGWKSFWYHMWAHHGPQCVVSANNKSQISCKIQFSGTLPAKGMRCRATRRDIHCCLTASYHSLNISGWLEELLVA